MIVKTLLHHSFKKFFRPECKNQLHFSFLVGSPVRAAWYQLEDILTDSMFTRERARGCNYCNWLSYRIDYSPKTWDSTVGFNSLAPNILSVCTALDSDYLRNDSVIDY